MRRVAAVVLVLCAAASGRAETLPTLRTHLKKAREIRNSLTTTK